MLPQYLVSLVLVYEKRYIVSELTLLVLFELLLESLSLFLDWTNIVLLLF